MYQMRMRAKRVGSGMDFMAATKGRTLDKWHHILGHINFWTIKMLKKNNLVTGLHIDKSQAPTQCLVCIQGKQHVELFPQQLAETVKNIGDLILSDVWGPAQVEGPVCEHYFFSYIDFKTRFSGLYFRPTKNKVLRHFVMFKGFIETKTGNKVK